jgi:hypothetical protein
VLSLFVWEEFVMVELLSLCAMHSVSALKSVYLTGGCGECVWLVQKSESKTTLEELTTRRHVQVKKEQKQKEIKEVF